MTQGFHENDEKIREQYANYNNRWRRPGGEIRTTIKG